MGRLIGQFVSPVTAKGLDYICQAQSKSGWWRDFTTLAGVSDEWVTAFIGAALAGIPLPAAQVAAQKAWKALESRAQRKGGWSYHLQVPVDHDSTAWALRLFNALHPDVEERLQRVQQFLPSPLGADGGLSTYADAGPIRQFTGLGEDVSFAGWCQSHVCVTASAGPVLSPADQAKAAHFLLQAQHPSGKWESYWWSIPEYATFYALEFLLKLPEAGEAVAKARAWVETRCNTYLRRAMRLEQRPYLDTFKGAYLLLLLGLCQPKPVIKEMQERIHEILLELQLENGSWAPAAGLRVPPPGMVDPSTFLHWAKNGRGGGSVNEDQHGLFTTATILYALEQAHFH